MKKLVVIAAVLVNPLFASAPQTASTQKTAQEKEVCATATLHRHGVHAIGYSYKLGDTSITISFKSKAMLLKAKLPSEGSLTLEKTAQEVTPEMANKARDIIQKILALSAQKDTKTFLGISYQSTQGVRR